MFSDIIGGKSVRRRAKSGARMTAMRRRAERTADRMARGEGLEWRVRAKEASARRADAPRRA